MNTTAQAFDVYEFLPLIRSIASGLHIPVDGRALLDRDDLIQEGFVALLEASKRWNPEFETRLSTFAFKRIRGAMVDAILHTNRSRTLGFVDMASCQDPSGSLPFLYGHKLKEKLRELSQLDRCLIAGLFDERSNRVRCREAGLTIWQYRRRQLKAISALRTRLNGNGRFRMASHG